MCTGNAVSPGRASVTAPACTFAPAGGAHRRNQKSFYAFVRRVRLTHCPRLPTADPARSTSHEKALLFPARGGRSGCAGVRPLVPLAPDAPGQLLYPVFLLAAYDQWGLARWSARRSGGGPSRTAAVKPCFPSAPGVPPFFAGNPGFTARREQKTALFDAPGRYSGPVHFGRAPAGEGPETRCNNDGFCFRR